MASSLTAYSESVRQSPSRNPRRVLFVDAIYMVILQFTTNASSYLWYYISPFDGLLIATLIHYLSLSMTCSTGSGHFESSPGVRSSNSFKRLHNSHLYQELINTSLTAVIDHASTLTTPSSLSSPLDRIRSLTTSNPSSHLLPRPFTLHLQPLSTVPSHQQDFTSP
jgi:hypothetical protein